MRRVALIAALLVGCGGGPRPSQPLRTRLAADESAAARERAPELAAQVEAALDDADAAAAAGSPEAADDHLTRARLLLEAAQAEAARIDDERARRAVEEEVARIRDRARRDERARAALEAVLALPSVRPVGATPATGLVFRKPDRLEVAWGP